MDELSAAWVAGLFEGEGTIIFTSKNSIAVNVFMTDLDVLQKLHAVSGVGTLRGPYSNKSRPTHKPIWKWSINRGSEVDDFLRTIRPHMGERRKKRIDEALERLSNMRGRERCSRGHKNWRTDGKGKRYCRDCATEAQQRRRAHDEKQRELVTVAPPRVPERFDALLSL